MLELSRKTTPREKLVVGLSGVLIGMMFWKTLTLGIIPYRPELTWATENFAALIGFLIGIYFAFVNRDVLINALFFGGSAFGALSAAAFHGYYIYLYVGSIAGIYYLFVCLLKYFDVALDKPEAW